MVTLSPYVFVTTDKGNSWRAITGNLPVRGTSYAFAEDHIDPNLIFIGTEFGIFFSNTAGQQWKQLKAGMPTIGVKDIAIQKRENDLVLATLGRGFAVLDDYSTLRNIGESTLAQEAELFPVRDALMWEPSTPLGLPGKSFQGDNFYTAENLGPVAILTYYLKEDIQSATEMRKEAEKKRRDAGTDNNYPSKEQLDAETAEKQAYLLFTIKDANGNVVRKLTEQPKAGVNRIQWDLSYPLKDPIDFSVPPFYNPFSGGSLNHLVQPGQYSVTLSKSVNGEVAEIAGPVVFNVKTLDNRTLPAGSRTELTNFQSKVNELGRSLSASQQAIGEIRNQLKHIDASINNLQTDQELMTQSNNIKDELFGIEVLLNGDRNAARLDIGTPMPVSGRVGWLLYAQSNSTSNPSKHHMESYEIALEEYRPLLAGIRKILLEDLPELQEALSALGAPYTPYAVPDLIEIGN